MMSNQSIIFYTDDDADDLDYFKKVVRTISSDFEVVTLNNGRKLLDLLDNPPPKPHIVFLDLNMPGLSGFDILEKVRGSETHKSLPVVIFSTSGDERAIAKSREMGANFFVTKSPDYLRLKKSIEYALAIDWNTFNPEKQGFVYSDN